MISLENPEACTGCLRCELACSYHHTRKYSRSHSSIRVDKCISYPKQGVRINIYHTQQGSHPPCDSCENEEGFPLCIQLCPEEVFKGGK